MSDLRSVPQSRSDAPAARDRRAATLALVTCAAFPDLYTDDAALVAALHARGVATAACVWDDPTVDWPCFDAVLIRTPWDYFLRYREFLAWCDGREADGVPVLNPLPLLRWNGDKRYLLDLAARGVEIVPTALVAGGALRDAVRAATGEIVVKPTVSAGARHTLRGRADDAGFLADVATLPPESDYLLQPYVPEIATQGEWSLLFFDGVYSHAVLKRPQAGDYRVQFMFGGSATPAEPGDALLDAAQRAIDALAALGHGDHAYLRIDGVVVDGRFRLMELEAIEPLLYFEQQPAAADTFAERLARRLRSLRGPIGGDSRT